MSINSRERKSKWQLSYFKLRTKFVLVFLLISLSSVTAVALTVNYTTSETLVKTAGIDLNNLSNSQGFAVGDLLAHQIDLLQSLTLNEILISKATLSNDFYPEKSEMIQTELAAKDVAWQNAVETDRTAQIILTNTSADELEGFRARFPNHQEIFITDKYGALLAATNMTTDYYQGDETWWQIAYNDGLGSTYIGQPAFDESRGVLGLAMAVPIYDADGESVIGILRSVYDLTTIGDVLHAATITEDELYLDMLLSDGRVLQTPQLLSSDLAAWEAIKTAVPLDKPIIDTLQTHTFARIVLDDVSNLASLSPITTIDQDPLITNLGWQVMAHQEQQSALALVTAQQRNILVLAGFILGISIIGALVAAQFLTKPILRLTAVAQQVREGNLDVQAPIESHDEIGDLAETFNSMTDRLRLVITQLKDHSDLLEQRVAQRTAEIERQQKMLDVILSTTPNYFFIFDQQCRYSYASPPALANMGVDLEQITGKTWQEIPLFELDEFQNELDLVFSTKDTVANEFSIKSGGDEQAVQHFDYALDPVYDKTGQVVSIVATIRDVSEKKAEQEAMWHTQKMESLGILAGGVAHDFNNLLVAMLSQTSLALLKMEPDAPARRHMEKVLQAAERAAALTKQMLDYSGRGTFDMQAIQLNQLIQDNVHLLTAVIPKHVHLQLNLDETLPLFLGDPGQIQQIVMNLILNAAEAIQSEIGQVTICTKTKEITEADELYWHLTNQPLLPGPYIMLCVKDNGSGMDSETVSKIFDPFFTTKFTGRGLGLAASLGIVRGHKGGLAVTSQPGVGTTFELLFPITATTTTDLIVQPEPELFRQLPKSAHTVLVIDDEKPVREAIVDILGMEGIKVLIAADGETAVALYRQNSHIIDLLILDLSMPGLSGQQTFQQLKQINPEAKIILSSGYSAGEISRQFADEAITDFLSKPYKMATLIRTVEQHLQP
ncbi:MAG: response regulator [Anaerolineae bacterium]|nr:response regulator [Anaerolineae bacterium]